MSDLFSLRAHFRAFGFVVLPAALDPVLTAALTREGDRAIRDATGSRYRPDATGRDDATTGHYVPATGERTPVSVELMERFAPLVADLTGVPLLPSVVQHALLFDCTGWHTDTGHAVPSAKVVAYTAPLDAGNGALRVLPGSHRLDRRVLADLLHGPAFRDDDTVHDAIRAVPGYVVASRPGDVIVFDEHVWHASVDGRDRHQWSAAYVLDPSTAEEELAVRAYLASQFSPDYRLDYDPAHYPHYGPGIAPRWLARLDHLGAVAAARVEQGCS